MKLRISSIVAIGLLCAAPSQGADHELSFELGSFANNDPQYDLYGHSDTMVSFGLRGGFKVHDRISLIGSYHHHQKGARVITDWDENEGVLSEFVAAYNADIVGLGVKADLQPLQWLQVYTSAQGLLYMGKIRLDQDPDTRTNLGQIKASGISGGAQWLGGVELQIHKDNFPIGLGIYVEAGYGIIAKHGYRGAKDVNADTSGFNKEDTLSTMSPSGFVIRSGIGARF